MTGLAAVQARIGSIQDRMSELRLTQASGGAVMGGASAATGVPPGTAAGGAQFAGMLDSLTPPDAAGGTTTAGLFGFVPAGTKLVTIPGTQAHAQAAVEAALAAQQESVNWAAALTTPPAAALIDVAVSIGAGVGAAGAGAGAAGAGAGATRVESASAGPDGADADAAGAAGAVAAPRAASGGAGDGSGKSNDSQKPAESGAVGTVGGGAPSVPVTAPVTPPVAAPAPKSGGLTGQRVVDTAKKYLGVPYVWGGETRKGLDCSGLVQRTFLDHGIKLPRTARALMKAGTEVPSLAQARPGDLIITRGGGHVSIYMGDNKIIHAPYKGEVVKIQKNYSTDASIDTIRRIV